jgi:surface antigen
MVDVLDQRRVVRDHGVKARQHEAELKALEDPTIVVDVRWQNLP